MNNPNQNNLMNFIKENNFKKRDSKFTSNIHTIN